MRFLWAIFLLGMFLCANSETCPEYEEIRPCTCEDLDTGNILVTCENEDKDLELEDFAQPVKSLTGKKNVEVIIEGYDLDKLPMDFFRGIGIIKLDINRCTVRSIAGDDEVILLGLEDSLEEIMIERSIVEDNDLSKLKFGHLRKLKKLDFSYNSIKELSNSWFENSTVEDITMIQNDIQIIGDRAFASASNLKELYIEGNSFGPIKRSMLPSPADHLEGLYIDNNALTSLPKDVFSNMPSLSKLSLGANEISRLDQDTWELIWEQLDYLYLDDNPLQCDSHMDWAFDLSTPFFLLGTCDSSTEENETSLRDFIDNKGRSL